MSEDESFDLGDLLPQAPDTPPVSEKEAEFMGESGLAVTGKARMEAAYGTINEASPAAAQPQPGPAQAVTPHHLPRIVRLNRHPVQAPG